MPIRFRCAYCNQLMGIARRKAGTVVRCPKCAGEIIVPVPDGPAGPEDAADQAAGANAFDVERLDPAAFPDLAQGNAAATAATPKEPEPADRNPLRRRPPRLHQRRRSVSASSCRSACSSSSSAWSCCC